MRYIEFMWATDVCIILMRERERERERDAFLTEQHSGYNIAFTRDEKMWQFLRESSRFESSIHNPQFHSASAVKM
jgi:hypothetical protein